MVESVVQGVRISRWLAHGCRCTSTSLLYKHAHLDLAYFGGHARHILPIPSPSQPVIADEEITCWGTLLNFFAFFALGDLPFFVPPTPRFYFVSFSYCLPERAVSLSFHDSVLL